LLLEKGRTEQKKLGISLCFALGVQKIGTEEEWINVFMLDSQQEIDENVCCYLRAF
jgi:hypothetical protein